MDNVTHTLIGLYVAEAALHVAHFSEPDAARRVRGPAFLASILANNFPDLDFVYTSITGGKLGYLLHHRGHTHTLAAALPIALCSFAAAMAWYKWKQRHDAPDASSRWLLLVLSLAGPLLHLAFDALNNYGVHPFWPVDNRWFYGDTLFIIEPWLFVIFIGGLSGLMLTRSARALLLVILGVVLTLSWVLTLVPMPVALVLTLAALLLLMLSGRLRRGQALGLTSALLVAVMTIFAGSRALAKTITEKHFQQVHDTTLLEVATTPNPGNPFCYDVLVVARNATQYFTHLLHVAPLPGFSDAERCPRTSWGRTVELDAPTTRRGPNGRVHPVGSWQLPLTALADLQQDNCVARAFFRFSRTPFLQGETDDSMILGDFRYDREKELGFAEFETPKHPQACPRYVPPWHPPRSDVLGLPDAN